MFRILFLLSGVLASFVASAQDLHFNTTGPAWADGARSNSYTQIGTPAVDVGVDVGSTGGSTTFTLGTPKGVSTGLQLAVNFSTTGDTKVVTIVFGRGVAGLSFSILGIDKNANSQDKVTVSGTIGRRDSPPMLTPSAYVTQSGNTLTGTADDPGSSASGVAFGGYVDRVVITFGCGPSSPANPGTQGITIGHLSWSGPLPVGLTLFTADTQGRGIQLNWATDWEHNASQFVVERSRDLIEFRSLATIPTRGTTDQRQAYSFADEWPLDGTNYYRLQQVDYDGHMAYSKIVAATAGESEPVLELLGNPTTGSDIRIYTRNMAGSTFRLFTPFGHEYPLDSVADGDGTVRLTPVGPISPGTYWLRADTAGLRLVRPIIIR